MRNTLTKDILYVGLLVILLLLGLMPKKSNAATVNYTATDAGIVFYGRVLAPDPNNRLFQATGSQAVVVVTGSSATMQVYSTTTNGCTVQVDGGTISTPSLTAGATQTTTLFTGLPDTDHLVIITRSTGFFYATAANFLQVTGASPALRLPAASDGAGYGPVTLLKTAGNGVVIGPWSSNTNSGYSSPATAYVTWTDAALSARGRAATLRGWFYLDGATVSLECDGVRVALTTLPNTLTFGWVTLGTGLDATADHTYSVTTRDGGGTGIPATTFDALMWVGGTGLSAASAPVRPFILAAYGDSIPAGNSGGPGIGVAALHDSAVGFVQQVGTAMGAAVYNRCINGTYVTIGGSVSGSVRMADVTSISPAPKWLIVLYGANDVSNGQAVGDTSTSGTFTYTYKSMLSALVAGLPVTTKIFVLTILPRTDRTPNQIAAYNAGITAAVTAVGASNITQIDTSAWGLLQNNGAASNYTDPSGNYDNSVHPGGKGYQIMSLRLLPYLQSGLFSRRFSLGSSRASSRSSQ